MARESKHLEDEFIATVKEKTGKELSEWLTIAANCGESKTNSILNWLKTNHKLNHLQANFITIIYQNDGKPTQDYELLFANLFTKLEHQKPLYDALEKLIAQTFSAAEDVVCIPTKTYVSIEGKKVFACAKINKDNMRVGLDMGDAPFTDKLQAAKSLGAMPNIQHMIEIRSMDEINTDLASFLRQSYDGVHKK
jgi:predicted transport protein